MRTSSGADTWRAIASPSGSVASIPSRQPWSGRASRNSRASAFRTSTGPSASATAATTTSWGFMSCWGAGRMPSMNCWGCVDPPAPNASRSGGPCSPAVNSPQPSSCGARTTTPSARRFVRSSQPSRLSTPCCRVGASCVTSGSPPCNRRCSTGSCCVGSMRERSARCSMAISRTTTAAGGPSASMPRCSDRTRMCCRGCTHSNSHRVG